MAEQKFEICPRCGRTVHVLLNGTLGRHRYTINRVEYPCVEGTQPPTPTGELARKRGVVARALARAERAEAECDRLTEENERLRAQLKVWEAKRTVGGPPRPYTPNWKAST